MTSKEVKEPEDLGARIGSKEEASWTRVLKQSEELLITAKENVEINSTIIELAKTKIAEEKEKFK